MITIMEKAAPLVHTIEHMAHAGNPLREMLSHESRPTVCTLLNVLEMLGEKKEAS